MSCSIRLFVASLTLVPLLGCKVDQQKEVATYRAVIDQQPGQVRFVRGEPLALEEVLRLANEHNEQIAFSGENYLQALIAKDRAVSAFLPTVSLGASYFESHTFNGPGGSGQSISSGTDLELGTRWNVFNGFRDLANVRAASSAINERRALLLDAQASVLLGVAQTYYQILRSEGNVEVLRASLLTQDERVRDIRARQKAGIARPLDVAQTEAQASQTRVALIAALNNVANGRSTLTALIGVPVEQSTLADEAKVPSTVPPLQELVDLALGTRQDLAADIAAVQVARQNVQAAIGQYYPSVNFNLNNLLAREGLGTERDWNYLLSANLPIFTAGQIHADVRSAWSRFRQALLNESATRRRIIEDVEIAYQNLTTSYPRLRELEVQATAAGEALRQAEQSYRVGLATNLERLTAQDSVLSAQLQLSSERYNQKVDYITLLRAIGTLSTRLPGEPATQPATLPATFPTTRPATPPPASQPLAP